MIDTFYILACSGPGAGQAIARSITIGYFSAAATAFVTIWLFRLSTRTGRYWPAYWSALLLALHPAWTISAVRGDCGIMKVVLSGLVILLVLLFLAIQIMAARRYKIDA
jgi:uncharacterized membrane protein